MGNVVELSKHPRELTSCIVGSHQPRACHLEDKVVESARVRIDLGLVKLVQIGDCRQKIVQRPARITPWQVCATR